MKYIGSYLGRIFLLSSYSGITEWKGIQEDEDGNSDYDLLEKYIIYEEGNLTHFKLKNITYYIYFSISNKIEVFAIDNGFVILDGLFFNNQLPFINNNFLIIEQVEETKLKITIEDNQLFIYDASLETNSMINSFFDKTYDDRLTLKLYPGEYSVAKIKISIDIDSQEIIVSGIKVTHL